LTPDGRRATIIEFDSGHVLHAWPEPHRAWAQEGSQAGRPPAARTPDPRRYHVRMAGSDLIPTPPAELRERLAGTRGLLIDLDGVLMLRGEAIPGAVDAMDRLEQSRLPCRILTNTSLVSRRTLSLQAAILGFRIEPDHIVSALSATAAHTRRAFAGRPIYVLAAPDARREFAGQWLVSHAEADTPGMAVDAVVVGDSPEELTYANVNRAFRFIRDGAAFIAVHRNPWWSTVGGPTIDAGLFVVGLEYSSGTIATVIGKPSSGIFAEAASQIAAGSAAAGSAAAGSPAADATAGLVMVGDDLVMDVAGGLAAGLRTVLVLTGRSSPEDVARAARGEPPASGAPIVPIAIAPSIAGVVDALAR
jgi:HAD superfamily hydrolase (TIGR01458 family)